MTTNDKKVCTHCKIIYDQVMEFCSNCGRPLTLPEIHNNEWMKKFLEVDDKMLGRFKEIRKQIIAEARKRSLRRGPIKVLGISGSARDQYDTSAESSNSEFLLEQALYDLEKLGAKTDLVKLRKYNIKPCKACYSTTNAQCHFYCSCYPRGTVDGDDMSNVLYDKILAADVILFATPVNNFKISSWMALFLDRCISLDGSPYPADLNAVKDKATNIKHSKFIELMADQKIPGSGYYRRFIGKVAGIITTGHEEGTSMAISCLYMTLSHYGMAFAPWSNMYAMSSLMNPTYKDKKIVTSRTFIEDAVYTARNAYTLAKNLRRMKTSVWQEDYSAN